MVSGAIFCPLPCSIVLFIETITVVYNKKMLKKPFVGECHFSASTKLIHLHVCFFLKFVIVNG